MNKQKFANLFLAGIVGVNFANPPKLAAFWDKWQERQEARIEKRLEKQASPAGLQKRSEERVEKRLEKALGKRAMIGRGEVTAKTGTSLTVTSAGKVYTVLTDDKTKFRRRFWGKSSLEEIAVGNLVNVIGKWANEEKTEINALLIRNLSVQKRYGVTFGTVKSVSAGGFVIETPKKGDLTVTLDSTTRLVNREMKAIFLVDIQAGHRVRVKGLWDNLGHTIDTVKEVKDFTIPLQPSPTPKTE